VTVREALLLDSRGVSSAADQTGVAYAFVLAARRLNAPVVVSAITLAEVLRGRPRDAAVHRLLKGCRVEAASRELGRAAGELLGRTGRKDTVDAVVAVTAAALPGPVRVLTSDVGDLGALTEEFAGVTVEPV
jgi:predicted nucleic acid-binding protein